MEIHSAQRRRFSAAFLLLCSTLLFSGCSNSLAHKASKDTDPPPTGKVVYAISDIPEGNAIKNEYLEERELEFSKIPIDALTSAALVVGRSAKYGIASGQIISQHDIAPHQDGRLLSLRLTDAEYERIEDQADKGNLLPEDLIIQWIQDKLEE